MSSISKMQIRGIRSFSPDRDETIEFYSPLTMIVGSNGCGKTTIIESLKFACTGSLPPNTKSGQSLVNDPMMTDSTAVKAHIKLRFQNQSDQTCVAVRSLQVLKKKTKLEFKALEGVLRTTNKDGEKVSISMKCSDIDRIIPENLGISPAIIENVIFVHQEDCNWPMQEGIVLKKRFDDVFESTRYTKALDALSKTKKEVQAKAKDLKGELMEFAAHLQSTVLSKKELESCSENQENCKGELDRLSTEIEDNQERVAKCTEVMDRVRARAAQVQQLEWQVQEAERRVLEKRQNLESPLEGTDAELKRDIADFDNVMKQRNDELQTLQRAIAALNTDIAKIRERTDSLNLKRGQVVMLQDQSKQLRDQQAQLGATLQRKYALPTLPVASGGSSGWGPNVVCTFITNLSNELHRIQTDCNACISTARQVAEEQEKLCQDLAGRISQLDVELRLKDDELRGLSEESNAKRVELSRLASSRGAIQQCQLDFENAQRTHDEFMNSHATKSAQYKKQIKDATDQIRDLQETISADSTLLQDLSMHRNEIAALDGSIKQLKLDADQVIADVSSTFRCNAEHLGDRAEPHTQAELEQVLEEINLLSGDAQKEQHRTAEEVAIHRSEVAGEEAVITQLNARKQRLSQRTAQLQEKQATLLDLIAQLNELVNNKVLFQSGLELVSNSASIDEVFEATKRTEEEAKELLVLARANKIFNKRFTKYRQNNGGACPCCAQSMTPAVEKVYEKNVKELFALSDENDQQQASLEEHKFVSAKCTSLYTAVKELHAEMQPLVELQQEILSIDEQVEDHSKTVAELRKNLQLADTGMREAERTAQAFTKLIRELNDANLRWQTVSKRTAEFTEKKRRQSQSLMSVDMGSRSFEDLEQAQRSNSDAKDELQAKKDRLTAEEGNLTKRFYTLKSMLSEAEKALSDAKVDGARHGEVEAAIAKIQSRTAEIEERKEAVSRERSQLARELSEQQLALREAKAALVKEEELSRGKNAMAKADKDSFTKVTDSLEDVEKRLQQADLADVNNALAEAQESIQIKEEEVRVQSLVVAAATAELASQEHTRRNMIANMDLRSNVVELNVLREQLLAQQAEHGGADQASTMRDAERDLARIQRQQQTLVSSRDTLRGKLEIYTHQAVDLRNKLNHPTYKGIEERHRRKNIEFETTNLAIADLESYYNALDKALQNFHTLKIREINKIIRELWQLIYKGQDIDSIEIESGQEEGAAASKNSRSYNYRVVMRKGDIPLDMRGRCSAGQKVLAAIVIRLALAETFCLNCGMLALDEPTTNLDEPNKAGLAHALARIIKSRSAQHNFQLICITHDEEFVKLMGNELSSSADFNLPEYYFRVYRQEEGNSGKFFSHIERIPWEDM